MAALFQVEGRDLACARGGRTIFHALNFGVAEGGLLILEGPNGSGKTSLLRMIAGFLPPAEGTIAFVSSDRTLVDAEERSKTVGWFGHQDAAKPQLTVGEIAAFYVGCYGTRADIDGALKTFGLITLKDIPCQFLSAGQKRRLALVRLSLSGRRVWLLDEPLAALDAAGKKLVANMIRDHLAARGIAIVATHEGLDIKGRTLALPNIRNA